MNAVLNPKDNAVIGCAVKFIIKLRAFLIDTGPQVKLWAASADEPDTMTDTWSSMEMRPTLQHGRDLLVVIGRVEHFQVFINAR